MIKAQALLANAGYYDLPAPGMPTGWPGGELNTALTRFQKDHGLDPDGTLLPLGPFGVAQNGVGETAQALKLQLFDRLQRYAPPTVAEVDRFYGGRRPGEPEPATNVVLKSADGDSGSGEPVGLKPVMMSDEPPVQFEPQPGEQTAYAGKLVGEIAKQGAKNAHKIPNLLRSLGILAPAATLALPADTPQTDRDALRPPEPAQPEEDRQQQDFARPQRGRIIIPKTAGNCTSRRSVPGPRSSARKSDRLRIRSTMRSPRRWRPGMAAAGAASIPRKVSMLPFKGVSKHSGMCFPRQTSSILPGAMKMERLKMSL